LQTVKTARIYTPLNISEGQNGHKNQPAERLAADSREKVLMDSITRWVRGQLRQYDMLMRMQGFPPAVRTALQFAVVVIVIIAMVAIVGLFIELWWLFLVAAVAWWFIKRR
jgi:hypothetical protein